MHSQFDVLKYPLVIEPAVQFLEILVRARVPRGNGESTKTYWSTFHRLPLRWNLPLPIDNNTPHLFGNSKHLCRCDAILGYGPSGAIAAVYRREAREWRAEQLPEEQTGVVPAAPSVRLVFESEEERRAFVELLRAVGKGGTVPGEYRELAAKALRTMRVVSVAKELTGVES